MAISAFAVMNPVTTMAMVDIARWRPVVYADTPKTVARFKKFIDTKRPEPRKVVLFLFGASYLQDVLKHRDRINSILLFDDLQNLHNVSKQISGVKIVDIDDGHPKHLSPAELMDIINQPTRFPESVLLSQITKALAQRGPSVLETTSRMPSPEVAPESGAQRMLAELKHGLSDDLSFAVVLDTYVKYLFRIITRSKVTKDVTKKIPDSTKDIWRQALDFADSDIGLTMAHAYRDLCHTSDPDVTTSSVIAKRGIKAYGGDFLYFTSILPPHLTCEFLTDVFSSSSKDPQPLVTVTKVPPPLVKATKSKGKAAGRKS